MLAEVAERGAERFRARLRHETGLAVDDDVERPACVRRRHDRLAGEERLVGHHPEVLVDRRVEDRAAAGVELGELLGVDPAGEPDPAVEATALGDDLEAVAVGAGARDDHLERGVGGRSVEQQVDALREVEPSHGEHEVAELLEAVVERLRGREHDLRLQSERVAEAVGDVPRDREQPLGLAEGAPVELVDLAPGGAVDRGLAELRERRAIEVVGLAELVHEPDALARMPHGVARELRRDQQVDLATFDLLEVEHPPHERALEHARARVPLERHGHERGLVPARVQLLGQALREHLGAAVRERHLRVGDDDPHLRAWIA